jgi:hypothetical protein
MWPSLALGTTRVNASLSRTVQKMTSRTLEEHLTQTPLLLPAAYKMSAINARVLLYRGAMTATQRTTSTKVQGTVHLTWTPTPALTFRIHQTASVAKLEFGDLTLHFPGGRADAFFTNFGRELRGTLKTNPCLVQRSKSKDPLRTSPVVITHVSAS